MITFSMVTETARQPEVPEWMRGERYMYCEQTAADSYSERKSGIYGKIRRSLFVKER